MCFSPLFSFSKPAMLLTSREDTISFKSYSRSSIHCKKGTGCIPESSKGVRLQVREDAWHTIGSLDNPKGTLVISDMFPATCLWSILDGAEGQREEGSLPLLSWHPPYKLPFSQIWGCRCHGLRYLCLLLLQTPVSTKVSYVQSCVFGR